MRKTLQMILLVSTVGFFSAGIGIGGGAILVPGIMRLGGYDFRRAGSLSLSMIAPITLIGAITHLAFLEGFPFFSLAFFVLAGGAGVMLGGSSLYRIPTRFLLISFSLFLLIAGIKMLTGWHIAALSIQAMSSTLSEYPFISLVTFGLIIGTVSSLLGVGGGLIIVPFCVYAIGFKIHVAITFSLIAMFLLASAGVFDRYHRNMLDISVSTGLVPAALVGAIAGAAVSSQLPEQILTSIFGMFLLAMALKYIYGELRQLIIIRGDES